MKGFFGSIEEVTLENHDYRRVIYTAKHSQLVLMDLKPREEIGMETHEENDQFLRFEAGSGTVTIDGNDYPVTDGDAVVVPAGAKHNVINNSDSESLKLYTIYSPPHHKDGLIQESKEIAGSSEEEFDGKITES